jgi:FAD/FMN-containing dehydrogenase
MVASDIHGKNHHVSGCFSQHVLAIRLRTGAGVVMDVSREQHPELFWATMGGMGLTGHILDVTVQLERVPSPWIYEESQRYDTLEEVFEALKRESKQFPMTVAWIDVMATGASLGRGIVMAGRWATASEAPSKAPRRGLSVPWPMTPPIPVTNAMTFTVASQLFFAKHPARRVHHVVNPSSFFWVLDSVRNWNRAYGPAGFTQYQCVLPSSVEQIREFLTKFRALGGCSFVNVFKDCGPENEGHLSFLKEGTSFTLDIPIRPSTPRLVYELNEWILDHGGRVYLAKDAFTTAAQFLRMYPRYSEWAEIRKQYDPQRTIRSALSTRLMGY